MYVLCTTYVRVKQTRTCIQKTDTQYVIMCISPHVYVCRLILKKKFTCCLFMP